MHAKIRQMQKIVTILAILICMAGNVDGQKLLILERPGTTKYFTYKPGERIKLYDRRNMRMIQGDISRIDDSMIVINTLEPVYLSRIAAVYRSRPILHRFSSAGIVAGVGYFLLSGFNRAINKESPVISNGTVITSVAVAGAGVATSFFRFRKFAIGDHWRIKAIDMDHPVK